MKYRFLSLLLALLLLPTLAFAAVFSDVSEDAWYYSDVISMYEQGIVSGKGNGSFDPNGTLTYAEALKLAVAARDAVYGDVVLPEAEGHWAIPYYEYALESGITSPLSTDVFDAPITRGGMFALFARVLAPSDYTPINDISSSQFATSDLDIVRLYNAGIVIGNSNGFESDKTITRAEAAAIIHRVVDPSARQYVKATGSSEYIFSDYQYEMLELVNATRAELGLEPVELDEDLCRAAAILAQEYAESGKVHQRADGRDENSVLDDLGIPRLKGNRRRDMTSNYAKTTYDSISGVHTAWMNSDGHRAEIVSGSAKYIGIGKVESNGQIYWVEVFSVNNELVDMPTESSSAGIITEEDSTFEAYQIEMLDLVNASRLAEGKGTLTLDVDLCKAAEQLALENSQGANPHKRLDGRHTGTVWKDLGLAFRGHDENYAQDAKTASDFHNAIMNSPNHRATLMGTPYTVYGVAKVTANGHTYWVELFSDNNLIITDNQSSDTSKDSQNSIEETGDYTFSDYQLETLELVNASRAELDLEPMTLDPELCKAAEQLALEYSQGSKVHKRLDGRLTISVLPELGLRVRAITENYSWSNMGGADTASVTHNSWLNSDGHRKEIVATRNVYMGIGRVQVGSNVYWVAVYSSN